MPAVDEQVKRVRATFSSDQEFRDAFKKAGFGNAEEYRKTLIESQKRQELQRKVIQKIKEDGKLIPVGVSEADITQAFDRTKSTAAPSAGDRHLPANRHHTQADCWRTKLRRAPRRTPSSPSSSAPGRARISSPRWPSVNRWT